MKLTVLGAGSCQYETNYSPSSHHVQLGETSLLLDAGPGATGRLIQNDISPHDLDVICVSHEHVDHSAGLLDLFQALYVRTKYHSKLSGTRPSDKVLTILAFQNAPKYIDILKQWAGVESEFLPIEVIEMGHEDVWSKGDCKITAYSVPHTDVSIGFRVEHRGYILGYTGDTNADPVLETMMKDADIALVNTAMPPSELERLDPQTAAKHAAHANVKKLVFAHLYPELVEQIDQIEEWVRSSYAGEYVVAQDGTTLEL